MDEVPRRTFCALAAASTSLLSGCPSMTDATAPTPAATDSRTVVTTRAELESAFADLSPGETVHVSAANAPYRTTQWLDIDADGVTVTGAGVRTLVEPARDANVGGIRVGHTQHCRDIDIRGIGYHGNAAGQSDTATRLHGIAVEDATNVTLARNHVRGTHPRSHGDGGSGISVARPCSDVRVVDNRIHDFGDRGVQLGGTRIQVFGNVVTDGLDRPIACDLWNTDGQNRTARNVSVFGNLLGNSREGSLVGVAGNDPEPSNRGYLSIFGNVGFGFHKSFCHVRGPEPLRHVSVQNNVSRQTTEGLRTDATTRFAGVAVDVDSATDLAIKNNELYDYSGHGVRVASAVSGLGVQQNAIVDPDMAGIRLEGGTDGVVDGNRITRPGTAGIRLERTADALVRGNAVQRAGTVGIVAGGSGSESGMHTDIAGNRVVANGRQSDGSPPAILVRTSGVGIRGNTITEHGGPAIAEAGTAGNNLYVANRADGARPWRISSPTSVVRNHVPAVDVHRGVTAGDGSDTVTVTFDRPYARPPRLSFGRTGGGIRERTYDIDGEGNYVGATLVTRRTGATVDVFVDG